jgi:hypothetical protein
MPIHELTELVIHLCIKIHKKLDPAVLRKYMKKFFVMNLPSLVFL